MDRCKPISERKMENNTIVPYTGLNHIEKLDCKGKPESKPLCGKNIEIQRVTSKNKNECPTCEEIVKS